MIDNFYIKSFQSFTKETWDEILISFKANISYTYWYLDYIETLNFENDIVNKSFVIESQGFIRAIVPCFVETVRKVNQISAGQEPIPAAIFNPKNSVKEKEFLEMLVINEVNKIASKYECILARFAFPPVLVFKCSDNFYLKHNYTDRVIFPRWYIFSAKSNFLIHLNSSVDNLKAKFRSRFKNYISKTSKKCTTIILDQKTFDQSTFLDYVDAYYEIKGKKRSIESFKKDRLGIIEGFEVIFLCLLENKIIGAIAIHQYSNLARYNSSMRIEKITDKIYPIHFLMSKVIEYLVDNECLLFDIGENSNSNNEKFKGLSFFKSGWGGIERPNLMAERKFK